MSVGSSPAGLTFYSHDHQHVRLKDITMKTHHRYIDEFVTLKCAADLLARSLFPNGKEITESMAAYNAVRQHRLANLDDPNVVVVVVGDGHVPRTGALFAMRSAWQVLSVDPVLRERDYNVNRLVCIRGKIEDNPLGFYKHAVIIAVHSHATITATLDNVFAERRSLVAIPCCVPYVHTVPPDVTYTDKSVWSDKNEVLVWKEI